MKTAHYKILALCCSIIYLLPVLNGCDFKIGGTPRVKYSRTVQLSAPFSPGSAFAAQTHNGSITVTGADVTDCNLTATITARAETHQEAQELAEQVKVKLEPSDNKLEAKITRPTLKSNQSVSVDLDAKIPAQADLHLKTHNGAVETSNIIGKIYGTTYNGNVVGAKVAGELKLQSHNGRINCSEVSGDTFARTYNGNVHISYLKTAPPVCKISIVTHNGGIVLTTQPGFSAKISASTYNGSIKTALPITVEGEISKTHLKGTIGQGQGKLELETYNGSITIK